MTCSFALSCRKWHTQLLSSHHSQKSTVHNRSMGLKAQKVCFTTLIANILSDSHYSLPTHFTPQIIRGLALSAPQLVTLASTPHTPRFHEGHGANDREKRSYCCPQSHDAGVCVRMYLGGLCWFAHQLLCLSRARVCTGSDTFLVTVCACNILICYNTRVADVH